MASSAAAPNSCGPEQQHAHAATLRRLPQVSLYVTKPGQEALAHDVLQSLTESSLCGGDGQVEGLEVCSLMLPIVTQVGPLSSRTLLTK